MFILVCIDPKHQKTRSSQPADACSGSWVWSLISTHRYCISSFPPAAVSYQAADEKTALRAYSKALLWVTLMLGGFKSSASVLEKEKLPVKEKCCVLLSFRNVNTVKQLGEMSGEEWLCQQGTWRWPMPGAKRVKWAQTIRAPADPRQELLSAEQTHARWSRTEEAELWHVIRKLGRSCGGVCWGPHGPPHSWQYWMLQQPVS